jgi:hypothetical protein
LPEQARGCLSWPPRSRQPPRSRHRRRARSLLELTGAKEPAALERLVKSVGAKPEAVNKDLLLYKGILSKLAAAKVGGAVDAAGWRRRTGLKPGGPQRGAAAAPPPPSPRPPCPGPHAANANAPAVDPPQELMREFLEREKKKQAERAAAKAEKAAGEPSSVQA